MRQFVMFLIVVFVAFNMVFSQSPKKSSSTEIYHSLQKLNFLGKALYIAAHPDDENTRLISYFSNEIKANTAYLSLTRGDGGQNLIGPELGELLGVLRTQELLAARNIDGGYQFFTRANDFGYSKNPEETLEIWGKKAILGDVVRVIRNFRPDIIINRFDHRTAGTTHGHHTASAILSMEAFDMANDPTSYPDQLKQTDLWQPKRLFFNTSWWFYGSEEKFEKADKSNMLKMDVGVYYPIKGLSNNEIASMASSQHLCQGFGRLTVRGSQYEYIELLKGVLPRDKNNIFDGIDSSWSRVNGGKAIGKILYNIEENFNFKNPSEHLPQLIEAYKLLQNISDEHWKIIKVKEIKDIIASVAALYLEATTKEGYTNPGNTVNIYLEVLNRSDAHITLRSVSIYPSKKAINPNILLEENKKENFEISLDVPKEMMYTSPYWLTERGSLGIYTVKDKSLIGKPETPKAFTANFILDFNGYTIQMERAVVHRYSKPDKGELYEPFEILPEVTASITDKVLIFTSSEAKKIAVKIKAGKNYLSGTVALNSPADWMVSPKTIVFNIDEKGDEQTVFFTIRPPANKSEGKIVPVISIGDRSYSKELVKIAYDHIPKQSILLPSEAKIVRLNIEKAGEHIGYIVGAGDKIPESLKQIGYIVHIVDPTKIQSGSLKKYDAVVVGIRAYNVVDELRFKQRFLLEYVKEGGNLIVQYNKVAARGSGIDNLAPYKIKLSRDRVTDENSKVSIIAKNHELVNFPNIITERDFDGWVQERGLYFPDEWGEEFTPILSMNDKGELAKKGSLLVAKYGKGYYIYTGISFFRELPVGISGAYKLFSNMLSIGKRVKKDNMIKE